MQKNANRVNNGPSRSYKVIDFCTNRKRVYDFLLVLNSNLGPILPRFRDISAFVATFSIPSLFRPTFQGVPFGVHQWYWGLQRTNTHTGFPIVKLFSKNSNLCPLSCVIIIRQRYDGRADRWTDHRNIARCVASCGKKTKTKPINTNSFSRVFCVAYSAYTVHS